MTTPNLAYAVLRARVVGLRWGMQERTWRTLRLRVLAVRKLNKETW